MLITIQINNDMDSIELLLDKEGLNFLRELINRDWYEPIEKGNNEYDFDHEHLASRDWGGQELSPEFTSMGSRKIQSLKIIYFGKEGSSLLS